MELDIFPVEGGILCSCLQGGEGAIADVFQQVATAIVQGAIQC